MSWNQTSVCTDHCSPEHKISTKSTRLAPPPSSPFSAALPGFGVSSSLMPLPGPMLSARLAFGYITHPDIHCPAPPATLVSLVLSEKTGAVSTIRTVTAQQTSRADGVSLMAYTIPTNEHSSSPSSEDSKSPQSQAHSCLLPEPAQAPCSSQHSLPCHPGHPSPLGLGRELGSSPPLHEPALCPFLGLECVLFTTQRPDWITGL